MDNDNLLSDLLTSLGTDSPDSTTSLNLESLSPHHHYQPSSFPESLIIGNPQAEMSRWHLQETEDSCGVATQQFGIENITNQNLSESQLRVEAEANGWYQQGVGTPVEDFGKLLAEQAHVPVESHFGGTIAEIEQKIIQGEEVFVGVNSQIEWLPDHQSLLGQIAPNLFDPHNFAGQTANHIVQVVGLEINPFDPQHSYVIVNDSGSPDGRGVEIPIDQFQQAMEASQGYIASTVIHGEQPPQTLEISDPSTNMIFGNRVHHHYHHIVPPRGYQDNSSSGGGDDLSNDMPNSSDGGDSSGSYSSCDSDGDGQCD